MKLNELENYRRIPRFLQKRLSSEGVETISDLRENRDEIFAWKGVGEGTQRRLTALFAEARDIEDMQKDPMAHALNRLADAISEHARAIRIGKML